MKIKINHISKTEGHLDFLGQLLNGDVKQAKIITTEGVRLIEGILNGRNYQDVPIITARICGICPIVHSLTAIKAIEVAFGVKPSSQTIKLRKVMELAQIIHSHVLHLYFLSIPDFYGIADDLNFIKMKPRQTQATITSRNFSAKLLNTIGGRVIHPIATEVGGFKVLPSKKQLEDILADFPEAMKAAINLALFTSKIPFPKFFRTTTFLSLKTKKEYAIYEGNFISSNGLNIKPQKYSKAISEIQLPYQAAKRAHFKGKSFMVGALARLNNNHSQLSNTAKKIVKDLKLKFPIHNTFLNILAQAIEVVHATEVISKILKDLIKTLKPERSLGRKLDLIAGANPQGKTTYGAAAMEAPRGTLFHAYQIDRDGNIIKAEIITPTVMFLSNLEEDLKVYLPDLKKLSKGQREQKIKTLIRAYDPCIACATH